MQAIEKYIFRESLLVFLGSLVVLTGTIWMTQALREVDLMTSKGQTILVFLRVTMLTIPSLVMVLAPVALLIATIYSLNRLSGDSELIIMNAAGMSPARLMRPYLWLATIVMVLTAIISLWLMPESFRSIRDLVSKIRTDVLTRIVREGQFITLDQGFIFHYRERGADGSLKGIFIQDRREKGKTNTYIAEAGRTFEIGDQNYLVLQKGSLQRQTANARDPAIVQFERYAIDLAQFSRQSQTVYKSRERLTWELIALKPDTPYVRSNYGKFRVELHKRFSEPLYAFVLVLIAFAALGQPRTTRQGRGTAILSAVLIAVAVRVSGFAVSAFAAKSQWAISLIYILPLAVICIAAASAVRPGWIEANARRALPVTPKPRAAT